MAKIRAVTTLNCILPFCETEDCQLEEVGKPNDLYTSRLGGSTTCVNKSWIAKLESMVGQGMPHPGEAGSSFVESVETSFTVVNPFSDG